MRWEMGNKLSISNIPIESAVLETAIGNRQIVGYRVNRPTHIAVPSQTNKMKELAI
jgi:hypothetical protein